MTTLSLQNIEKFLRQKKYDAQVQKETQQVYTVLKLQEREFPLFIRIYEGDELLQILVFFPCKLSEKTLADTGRLLHLFNKELDIPGFGMDEISQVVFFRCMVPVKKKQLDEELLETFLKTTELACQTFSLTIEAIAGGLVNLDEMIEKVKKESKKKKK